MSRWRWLWIGLGLSFGLLAWVGLRRPGAEGIAQGADAGAMPTCVLPPRFTDEHQPLQSPADPRMPPFRMHDATLTPLAGFSLQARVLSREDYRVGTTAKFSPVDLALGWGPMSAPGMAEALNVSQGGRFYRYGGASGGPPLPLPVIVRNSANMHMIPADANIAQALDDIENEDMVRIHGWLVRIDRDGGWRWQSSLTRQDSGGGACELVYVCAVERRTEVR